MENEVQGGDWGGWRVYNAKGYYTTDSSSTESCVFKFRQEKYLLKNVIHSNAVSSQYDKCKTQRQ